MEVSSYSKPAGVYSDIFDSYKPKKSEKVLAIITKTTNKVLSESESCQKSFRGKTMGTGLIGKLIENGQDPVVSLILSYLNWIDVSLMLLMTTNTRTKQALAIRAANHAEQILLKNSKLTDDKGGYNCNILAILKNLMCT